MIASLALLFLLITYPQRIIRQSLKTSYQPIPQQILLVVLIIACSAIPSTSFARGILYFLDYSTAISLSPSVNTDCFGLLFSSIQAEHSHAGFTGAVIFTSFILFFWASAMNIAGYKTLAVEIALRGSETQDATENDNKRTNADGHLTGVEMVTLTVKGVVEEGTEEQETEGTTKSIGCWARLEVLQNCIGSCWAGFVKRVLDFGWCCGCYYICGCFLCCNKQKCTNASSNVHIIRRGVTWGILALLFVYIVFVLIITNVLDFNAAVIPFSAIVTVLRVCLSKDSEDVFYCNSSKYPLGQSRMWASIVQVALELAIFIGIIRLSIQVQKKLGRVPYSYNRSNYLAFLFIRVTTTSLWAIVLLCALVETWVPDVDLWITDYTVNLDTKTLTNSTSPLFVVGVTSQHIGFNFYYFMQVTWMLVLAYCYLPANAIGLKGWFQIENVLEEDKRDPAQLLNNLMARKNEEEMNVLDKYLGNHPIYLEMERDFSTLHQKWDATGLEPSSANNEKKKSHKTPLLNYPDNPVVVFETEILMFNFACITYLLGTKKQPKTKEEEQQLIEDENFTLVDHVWDEELDTHAIIALSHDRVVLAFRGTASSQNIKTDMKMSFKHYELADSVEPVNSFPNVYAHRVRQPCMVHKGFLEAFERVSERLHAIIDPLLFEGGSESQTRLLCVTGHSLGGALAVLASFNFSCSIRDTDPSRKPSIKCTTFGCPKIGNLAFACRFDVRTSRFVLSRDIIVKTPLRKKYKHVGMELLLDLTGNLLINPSLAEKAMFNSIKRPVKRMHFLTRYCLAIILFSVASRSNEWEPDLWSPVLNRLIHYASEDMANANSELIKKAQGLFIKEGVQRIVGGRKMVTASTQYQAQAPEIHEEQVYEGIEQALEDEDGLLAALEQSKAVGILSEEQFLFLKERID
mmetsp:Transcript_28241/g.45463  ORF Transcript_28241/g.45463 Transcript_28241/m.45463 type:complete len:916 (+) Transcript_28241:3964-6711(+)